MEPTKMMMEKLEKNDNTFNDGSVLIGANKDEGSRALMYYLPRMFPNQELVSKTISRDMFEQAIFKIFDERVSTEVKTT